MFLKNNRQLGNVKKSAGYIKPMYPCTYQPYSKDKGLRIFGYTTTVDNDGVLCESADWQLLNLLKMQQVCKLKRLYGTLTCCIKQKQYQAKQQHQITLKCKRNHNNKQQHQQHLQTAIVVRKYLNNDDCIPIASNNFEEAKPMVDRFVCDGDEYLVELSSPQLARFLICKGLEMGLKNNIIDDERNVRNSLRNDILHFWRPDIYNGFSVIHALLMPVLKCTSFTLVVLIFRSV
uniref:Uncharacterized protein n=1 Tax=Glossina brevipalpis TaxID=37001 RepID=A0A1A9WBL6_9MUSC